MTNLLLAGTAPAAAFYFKSPPVSMCLPFEKARAYISTREAYPSAFANSTFARIVSSPSYDTHWLSL